MARRRTISYARHPEWPHFFFGFQRAAAAFLAIRLRVAGCNARARACPPEDCGGIPGYERLLKIISDPSHEEYESMMQWLGGQYDPEEFDPKEVQFDNPKKRLKMALSD